MKPTKLSIERIEGGYVVDQEGGHARIVIDEEELLSYLALTYAGEEGKRRWQGPHLCPECSRNVIEREAPCEGS